jgi:hypothetical protein
MAFPFPSQIPTSSTEDREIGEILRRWIGTTTMKMIMIHDNERSHGDGVDNWDENGEEEEEEEES